MGVWIWLAALAAYALFRAWYDNWRGPLKASEVEKYMSLLHETPGSAVNDREIIRRFLSDDDGREFFMLNLVKIQQGEVPHPQTGAPAPGPALMQRYAGKFMPALIARGGHPALVARPVGGYVDAWNAAPDPGWTIVGYMRYRSRRDLAELATDPRFHEIHPFKIAGTASTFSFPTQPRLLLLASPRLWVALVLALAAALAHLALLLTP